MRRLNLGWQSVLFHSSCVRKTWLVVPLDPCLELQVLQLLRNSLAWRQWVFLQGLCLLQVWLVKLRDSLEGGVSGKLSLQDGGWRGWLPCSYILQTVLCKTFNTLQKGIIKEEVKIFLHTWSIPWIVFSALISSLPGNTTFSFVSVGFKELEVNPSIPVRIPWWFFSCFMSSAVGSTFFSVESVGFSFRSPASSSL